MESLYLTLPTITMTTEMIIMLKETTKVRIGIKMTTANDKEMIRNIVRIATITIIIVITTTITTGTLTTTLIIKIEI